MRQWTTVITYPDRTDGVIKFGTLEEVLTEIATHRFLTNGECFATLVSYGNE